MAEVVAYLPDAEVVGAGELGSAEDASAFLYAGARAVQVGTALLHDPTTAARMILDLQGEQ